LGPYFQGETEEDEVMKLFETTFFVGKVGFIYAGSV
jgi:hypothetical protein